MKNFTSKKVRAYELFTDDHLKIGGQMYRITRVETSWIVSNRMSITAAPIVGDRQDYITFGLPRHTKVKIYNQA